jgi:hypothetical protein
MIDTLRVLAAALMFLAAVVLSATVVFVMWAGKSHAYDWQWHGGGGWATSAFQEQHGPRVKEAPRYRPHGPDRQYRPRPQKPRPVVVQAPQVDSWVRETRPGTTRRDATGDVHCWPHVEAWSVEANTEDGAWRDAQRNWEAQTRAMVGERWMEVANAKDIEKQCWVSSGNQSVAGRVAENVARVVGSETVDGRKHRCRIMARPCQAPKEYDPATKASQ